MPIHEAAGVLGFREWTRTDGTFLWSLLRLPFRATRPSLTFYQPVGVWLLVILPAGEVDPGGVVVIRVGSGCVCAQERGRAGV